MTNFNWYNNCLQLHDHHTFWRIKVPIDEYELLCVVSEYLQRLENQYHNLTIYQLGRSGRHICIDDTPVNRRRYQAVQNKAEELEEELIEYVNNNYKGE